MQKNKITKAYSNINRRPTINDIRHSSFDSRITILGIDPGLANLGYGLIQQSGSQLKFIRAGVIKTAVSSSQPERLLIISKELTKIIKKYKPDKVAVEELFFCKNVKTALAVGQAIGVILLTASQNKLLVSEFTPLEIKQTLTSYGRADKKQLAMMVKLILGLNNSSFPSHSTDALACAICCAQTKQW
jgi:crossover junction endodeoxyribonuclease RuvC